MRQVYFIIGMDDDHKPVQTTRICATPDAVLALKNEMSLHYDEVLICKEIELRDEVEN